MGKRLSERLTSPSINAKKEPGYYPDGGGLYLQVSASGSKSWIFRYMLDGRAREMGLGAYPAEMSLSQARREANECRKLKKEGIDPIEHRRAERERNRQAQHQWHTFEQCAREYHKLHAHGWKNAKHGQQWLNTLAAHAFPVFGDKDVSAVSKADILRALEPIWITKAETASRVKQRIRAVLDWAAARDYRRDHDPHLWEQIGSSLPKTRSIKKIEHFAACPYPDIHDVLQSIRGSGAGDTVKRAMEFLVLTAARSGEVRGARWSEIDFENRRWIIPAERMKAKLEHRVPLSAHAMEILEAQGGNGSELIFASEKGKQYSDMTFTMALRRLGHTFTVHGFRSTFRDWAAEQTAFPREVCEAALAHTAGKDATEAAYFRSDLFEKRRQLMQAWDNFCATEKRPAAVLSIGKALAQSSPP